MVLCVLNANKIFVNQLISTLNYFKPYYSLSFFFQNETFFQVTKDIFSEKLQ